MEPPPEDFCPLEPPLEDFHVFHSQTSSKTNKRSSPANIKQNKRSRVCHRKIQNSSNYRLEMMRCFVNHPGAADIKIQQKSPEFLRDMRYFCNFSLVSIGIRPRSCRCAERTRQGEGRRSRPPKPALEQSYLTEIFSSANRIPTPRPKKTPGRIPETRNDFIYTYMVIFFLDSVRSFFSSRPQYGISDFSAKSLRSSVVFGGRLKSPLPCRIRSAHGRDRVRGLSETSEK